MTSNNTNNNIDNNPAIQALSELRRAQQTSFGSSYKAIESEIENIKKSAQINYTSLSDGSYLKSAAWYFPPVAIQAGFLAFWILSLVCFYKIFKLKKIKIKYLFIFFLTTLVGVFLLFDLNQRKLNFAVIKRDTQLKLGPDKQHISRKDLKILDEVKVIDRVGTGIKLKLIV